MDDNEYYSHFERVPNGEVYVTPYERVPNTGAKILTIVPGSEPEKLKELIGEIN